MILNDWEKLNEGDLTFIIKDPEQRDSDIKIEILDARFLELMDEYFELTKDQSSREELFVLLQNVIEARQNVIDGDKAEINFVRKYEGMIKNLVGDTQVKINHNRERIRLSNYLKNGIIDKMKITVSDYLESINVAAELAKMNTSNG